MWVSPCTVPRGSPHHRRLGTGRRSPANPAPSESHRGIALSSPVFSFFQRHRGSRLTHITNLPSIRGETKPIASRLLCLVCSDFPPLICFSVSHSFSIKRGTARPQFILFKACITRHARDRRPASFKLCSDPVSTCTRAARSVCFALIVL